MHIWYQWQESVKPVTSMSNIIDNRMYHFLYLPKQYLMPCQSQQLGKMRHILSHSWLNYNWRTKATTDDLHQHLSIQVKRDDHTFSSKNCMETKVHSAKSKLWASLYIPRRLQHSKMIEQTIRVQCGTNWRGYYPESKTVWRVNLKWRVNTAKQKPSD